MRWCSMRPRCSIFPLSGGVGGLEFLCSQSFSYYSFKFPTHSHHVPNEFPRCFPNSQWVLQDVFNSTSLLSHINLCPKLSFWNLHRQAKEVTAIFRPWEWKLIFGSVSKVSLFLYLFSSFLVISQSKRPTWKNKISDWAYPQPSIDSVA